MGPRAELNGFESRALLMSGPSPLADFCSLDSMMERCCSRTVMLRCSCSWRTGSSVWKPGDRQASPTWCIPRPSLAVMGPAGPRTESVLADRSSLRGLGRGLLAVMLGEDGGSFLTTILGALLLCTALVSIYLRRAFQPQKPLTKKASSSRQGTTSPRLRHVSFETASRLTQRPMWDTVADSMLDPEQSAEEWQRSRAQLQ